MPRSSASSSWTMYGAARRRVEVEAGLRSPFANPSFVGAITLTAMLDPALGRFSACGGGRDFDAGTLVARAFSGPWPPAARRAAQGFVSPPPLIISAWQAKRLGDASGRDEACALPYGISTVSLFAGGARKTRRCRAAGGR